MTGTGGDHHHTLRDGPPDAPGHRKIHARRPSHRHRRRQPLHPGRRLTGRQPVSAPAGSAAQLRGLLEQSPVALVSFLRPVHRPDEPAAAHRRGPPRQPLRTGDRLRRTGSPDRAGPSLSAVAGGPAVPTPAGGCDRQHPPGGILHRQALFAGQRRRTTGAAGVSGLRDAATRQDEPGPTTVAAHLRGLVLADPLSRGPGALGHAASRPVHAAPGGA